MDLSEALGRKSTGEAPPAAVFFYSPDRASVHPERHLAGYCKPHFVGVWDTVSSVGWIENPLKLRFTADNPDIAIGRHAVSIDERRAFFRSNLWRPSPKLTEHGPRDIQQVWFPGVHCDVGGG